MFSVCVYLYSLTTGGNDTSICVVQLTMSVLLYSRLLQGPSLTPIIHVWYKHGTHHDTAVSVRGTVLVDT